jgi:DNA-binding response OmpR family regulator
MDLTIVVVDDDPCIRELAQLHLTAAGYRVLLADDAIVAGTYLLEQRIDLLVADIAMPFMDGLDLVRAIRADPLMSSLPVIFVTSHPEYEADARQLGAVAFLRKPFSADELIVTVNQYLRVGELSPKRHHAKPKALGAEKAD